MTSTQPFLSIVTVVYNDVDGLHATSKTISHQYFTDFEWVVVDGGSTDGTENALASYDLPFLNWVSETDDGIYDAMNKGISMSRGEYVVFMNAGDLFPSSKTLQAVHDSLNEVSCAPDVLFGGADLVFPNHRRVYRAPRRFEDRIWHGLPAVHQATYYRRERIVETQYDLQYRICGDYYIIAKLVKEGITAAYLDKPLADFMVGVGIAHNSKINAFFEPYQIQRDVLGLGFHIRALSLLKRTVSIFGASVLLTLSKFGIRKSAVEKGA